MSRFELWVMRHGEAEDYAEGGDAQRELTERGRPRVTAMGAAMAKLGVSPSVVVCSPLVRAQQTASLMVDALGLRIEPVIEPILVPAGDPRRVIDRLTSLASEGATMLAVGHNPSVTSLLGQLVCGDGGIHFAVATADLAHVSVETTSRGTRGVLRMFLPSANLSHML